MLLFVALVGGYRVWSKADLARAEAEAEPPGGFSFGVINAYNTGRDVVSIRAHGEDVAGDAIAVRGIPPPPPGPSAPQQPPPAPAGAGAESSDPGETVTAVVLGDRFTGALWETGVELGRTSFTRLGVEITVHFADRVVPHRLELRMGEEVAKAVPLQLGELAPGGSVGVDPLPLTPDR